MSAKKISERATFFSLITNYFPEVQISEIETETFLKASQDIVRLVEKLGKVFAPVKYDMCNNIEKLYLCYNRDKQRNKYLKVMIVAESKSNVNIGVDALLWLRRALHFISRFFTLIVEDYNNKTFVDITKHLRTAYEDTLQKYHGWMTQQLFNLICRMCPSREQFFELLSNTNGICDGVVVSDMDIYNSQLAFSVNELKNFYIECGFETQQVV